MEVGGEAEESGCVEEIRGRVEERRRRGGGGSRVVEEARPEERAAEGGAYGGRRRGKIWQPDGRRLNFRALVLSENEELGEEEEAGSFKAEAFRPGWCHQPGPKGLSSRLVPPTGTKDLPFRPGW